MATANTAPRRQSRTPARTRERSSAALDSTPPHKRRKYAPGGPGGGGRFLDSANKQKESVAGYEQDQDDQDELTIRVGGGDDDHDFQAETPFNAEEKSVSPRTVRRRTASRPRRDRDRVINRERPAANPRPRYSSAAAAAAASQASDGYKPREERSWEEFHPDLDIEASLIVLTADEVDGRAKHERKPSLLRQDSSVLDGDSQITTTRDIDDGRDQNPTSNGSMHISVATQMTTPKRKPGRPPRRPESMLSGLGSPPAPRIVPLPTHNPKERLNLPKPSYRHVETFEHFEQDKVVQKDYVDKAMAHVGYQESDRFEVPLDNFIRHSEGPYEDEIGNGLVLESDNKSGNSAQPLVGDVEYDMDEQDEKWLEGHNAYRKEEGVDPIKASIFEITMTQIEREYYALEKRIPKPNPRHHQAHRPRSSSAAAVNGEPSGTGDEPDSKCAICDDGDCENANAIIFCDGCDLAVHQECYGVPFIPEGQWFCRKCKEIGRGTPTCIFCPNIDGAFKQTATLRWSHLLCAIWIPEVTIANPTFMEPIQDVEKVPRNRWSLTCYICQQRMGACIQCSNKSCYQAFHVTCARRARLFLKMKTVNVPGIDTTALKAFCDRHVPPEWRREHKVDHAIHDAKRYYRHTMRDRRWADSQTAALSFNTNVQSTMPDQPDELGHGPDNNTIVVASLKRKKQQPAKTGWRLPSGAPVVPNVVFGTIEASLARFTIRKRKDFVAEACKYWTLKREARRGAALLKRLQLQLESFSSMEITRRNFVGLGAAGRPRLLRRIEFADMLTTDMARLLKLTDQVREREQRKVEDAENLKQLIDTVYFPISDMLWPIFDKAKRLDQNSQIFEQGLEVLEQKLSERYYTSVAAFSADIGSLLSAIVAPTDTHAVDDDNSLIHAQLNGVPVGSSEKPTLTQEQKDNKKVAKRIVRAIKEPLEVALRQEAELKGIPYAKEMDEWANLDSRLEKSITNSRRASLLNSVTNGELAYRPTTDISATAGASPTSRPSDDATGIRDVEMKDASDEAALVESENKDARPAQPLSPPISASSAILDRPPSISAASVHLGPTNHDPWACGGVPWYMHSFDPVGTTVHEERWTGPEQIRAMSEALSEMDEDTLIELGASNDETGNGPQKSSPVKRPRNSTSGGGDDANPTPKARVRASRRSKGAVEEGSSDGAVQVEERVETDKERIAREKREAYNAKRRRERALARGEKV